MAFTRLQQRFLDRVDYFISEKNLYAASEWQSRFNQTKRDFEFSASYVVPIPTTLLYWWTFDEYDELASLPYTLATGDIDYPEEYNGHNGTQAADADPGWAPKINSGGEFDNFVSYAAGMMGVLFAFPYVTNPANELVFPDSDGLTIDFWFTNAGGASLYAFPIGGGLGTENIQVILTNSGVDLNLRVYVRDNLGALQDTGLQTVLGIIPAPDIWHHCRINLEEDTNSVIRIFVDGLQVYENAFAGIASWEILDPAANQYLGIGGGGFSALNVDNLAIFEGSFPLPGDGTVPTQPNVWPGIS